MRTPIEALNSTPTTITVVHDCTDVILLFHFGFLKIDKVDETSVKSAAHRLRLSFLQP